MITEMRLKTTICDTLKNIWNEKIIFLGILIILQHFYNLIGM